MAFENKTRAELRKHFEALLSDGMRAMARNPSFSGEKAVPEFASTFRVGFKFALMTVGLIQKSTTELNDEQLRILCETIYNMLNLPPPPDSPFPNE